MVAVVVALALSGRTTTKLKAPILLEPQMLVAATVELVFQIHIQALLSFMLKVVAAAVQVMAPVPIGLEADTVEIR
jgi:hypothetical protein